MDTIDLSNLNRQFLFRESDIGKSKAEVAAAFVNERIEGCTVIPHNCRIEEKPPSFYRSFHIVVCGLDSVNARRWMNAMLCDLAQVNAMGEVEENTVIPMIDGGTEGFKGNARIIYPRMSACIDCTLDLYPPQMNFPLCTIAHTPRLPEHCVEYVKVIQWDELKPFQGADLDPDNPSHVDWVFEKAMERSQQYDIRGVDRRLTQGVLKRIIPAVASTNAVIAASCSIEALKLATNIANNINNYLNFNDVDGVYCGTVEMGRNPECPTCSRRSEVISVSRTDLLKNFLENLVRAFNLSDNPSLTTGTDSIYEVSDFFPDIAERSKNNLNRPLGDLVSENSELLLSDISLKSNNSISIRVKFTD
ncbi:hypothetical protein WR25_03405 [Diploscapter pachys]|uniref:NEDD8-activating enzyme E1 catalytic subunit n=1 Tax=Diploscapter pachys TaxID=2018661 RepID=A0A2A2LTX5_9BILA|nr:hypothetical protein WR25_03405 [Diploscapter pachys]